MIPYRKSILLVIHDCSFTGAPLLGLNIAKELNKQGFRVFILCLEKGEIYKRLKKEGIAFSCKTQKTLYIMLKILKLIGINKVICNTVVTGNVVKIASQMKFKVVTLIHELPDTIIQLGANDKAKEIVDYSSFVIFPNYYVKDKFKEKYKVNEKKTLVQPQGLYIKLTQLYNKTTRNKKRYKLGIQNDEKIILGVGVGGKRKGIDVFYNIACKMREIDKRLRFIWIGKIDPEYHWIIRQAKSNGILILPPTNHIDEYYKISDLYLLTSREDPFPSVVLEAIAYGIPVIGFKDAGGFSELDKKYIRLADFLNINEMIKLIIESVNDVNFIYYTKKYGRKYITSQYNMTNYINFITEKLLGGVL